MFVIYYNLSNGITQYVKYLYLTSVYLIEAIRSIEPIMQLQISIEECLHETVY